MSEYKLFGERITLSDSAERFFDLQQEAWDACDRAETDIKAWYQERDNIEDALDNYVGEAQSLVARYALTPLYNRLASEYEIFDISEKSYLETCFKRSKIEEAYDLIAEKFNAIIAEQNAHINLINKLKDEKYISFSSDSDKAGTLLENAKKVPEKAPELLVRSFTLYPWSYKLLKYIFVNYPQERANAWSISKRFHVDLTDDIEEAIAREYTDEDRHLEERAQEAKKRIVSIMQEYNVSESATLDTLEQDCIGRLCAGYEGADKAACLSMIANISEYDAQKKIKKPSLTDVQQRVYDLDKAYLEETCKACESTDKPGCFSLIDTINTYDTLEEIKAPFLKRVNQRLY